MGLNLNRIHRLVRISRLIVEQEDILVASVWVYPAVEDDINIKIDEKDLKIDTYRSMDNNMLTQQIAR